MLTNDATVDSALQTEIQWALESAINLLCFKADLASFRKDGIVNTAAGVREYELPDDFYKMVEPGVKFSEDPNWTLTLYDQQDFDRVGGDGLMQSQARPRHYTVRGQDEASGRWLMRLAPVPDKSYPITISYFGVVSRIANAATTDKIDKRFQPRFWRAVQFGAALEFPQYLSSDQQGFYSAKYNEYGLELQQSAPVTGRVHQNRRYRPGVRSSGSTWDLSGTDLVDSQGSAL